MKLTTALTAALTVCTANAAALQPRHYTFPSIDGTADWAAVRKTDNFQSNGPVTDVTSNQIRCYTSSNKGASSTRTVAAGNTVSFKVAPNIFHQGPLQFYMAKVPSGQSATTWDGSGNVWFKIYSEPAKVANGGLAWGSLNSGTASVKIPSNTPPGQYLLRVEHIALHQASQAGGAQFYISCAQIEVTGGGSGSPSPLVSFPGAYSANDPGIKVNIYATTSYKAPGPAVWSG